MALDVSKFATVARAEKSVHLYNHTDAYATVLAANYFANKNIISAISVGDIIVATCSDGVFILTVTAVTKSIGSTYAVTTALAKSGVAVPVANAAAVSTADGSDAATTQALANALKTKLNTVLAAMKTAGVMVAD